MSDRKPLSDPQRRNLEGYLAWVAKHRRGYVEADPWSVEVRLAFDLNWAHKHAQAVAWMTKNQVRRAAHAGGVGLHREGRARVASATARGIWTARKASRRNL